ncbi:hypothetical protein [Noviherbaspirillum saxi]|uniref:hypothetical protein n=1 Tax=Noviherbaspirillum saxi TaxID=2320863 RepID=UPI001313F0F4|nr:hypothetical protein [Noviherbaspirillum saxi]
MDKDFYQTDDFAMWVEDESSIHIKAITKQGDPVELSFDEVELIMEKLIEWTRRYR